MTKYSMNEKRERAAKVSKIGVEAGAKINE